MSERLKRIPAWIWLAALTVLLLAPFLNKAVNIDDPLFLWTAKHIQQHPADFFGFNVNWYNTSEPIGDIFNNPPGAAYFLALAGSLLGWEEWHLHLAFLLPAVAVVCGIYFLARNYCARPALATIAAMLTPVFLISASTLMSDVLMLSFWIWAMVFWERGLAKNHLGSLVLAGIFAGLCPLMKFNGITLLPLLAAYALMKKRNVGTWLLALIIPLLFVSGYEWVTRRLYGHGLLGIATGFASKDGQLSRGGFVTNVMLGLIFMGGCYLPTLFYAPRLWSRRAVVLIFCGVTLLTVFLVPYVWPLARVLWDKDHSPNWGVLVQTVFFAIAAGNLLLLSLAELWQRRDAVSVLLILWIGGTFVFASIINWTLNGRGLLPMMPALGILIARRFEWRVPNQNQGFSWRNFWPVFPAVAISLLLLKVDYDLANSSRQAAYDLSANYRKPGHTLWFEGHWGFQYYMEQLGAHVLDFTSSNPSQGDIIILPSDHSNVYGLPPGLARPIRDFEYAPNQFCATMNRPAGAGFYAREWGPIPFVVRSIVPEKFFVTEVIHSRDFSRDPFGRQQLPDTTSTNDVPKH